MKIYFSHELISTFQKREFRANRMSLRLYAFSVARHFLHDNMEEELETRKQI